MKICIIAGEASGDVHAAGVLRELRRIEPQVEAFGIGGAHLAAEGMEVLHDIEKMAVVGLFNVVRQLPMFRRIFEQTSARIERERPDAVLLVDYPGFNLRLARRCHRLGIPVIYYISPQVWAWRRGRINEIRETVDLMLPILPFEEAIYREHGIEARYVGNPLIEQLEPVKRSVPASEELVRIALMPGSRTMEVDSLLPAMIGAVEILKRERKVEAWIIKAPTIQADHLRSLMPPGASIDIVEERGRESLANADLSLMSSGTATLEAALLGVPAVVMYRLTAMTYLLAKQLVRLRFFSLVNIIGEKEIIPELLQSEVKSRVIADAAREVLKPENYERIRADLADVRRRLGDQKASRVAAEKIAAFVQAKNEPLAKVEGVS